MGEYEAKLYEIIGQMLKEARLRAGLTLEQTGEKIGVIAKTIQRYETGQRKISMDKLMELTSLFGVDYTSFMAAARNRLSQDSSGTECDDHLFSDNNYYLNDEVAQIAQQVYERPELRMLFSASRNVSPEDLMAVIALVDRMKKEDD